MTVHLSPSWQEKIACVKCHTPMGPTLRSNGQTRVTEVACSSCGFVCSVEDGIIRWRTTRNTLEAFYGEHGFTTTGMDFRPGVVGATALFLARHHYLYDVSRNIRAGSAVVELGCGGGSNYLARRYDMLGVDISTTSIRQAGHTYSSVVQASAGELPLADGSADAIISSCLLEHLDDELVSRCLAEMNRVLRHGGLMVHFLDLDTDGPFFGWAKRQGWFEPVFVTSKGHSGLRTLIRWRCLLRDAGFEIEAMRLFCKTWLQDLSIWATLDDPLVAGGARLAGRAARLLRAAAGRLGDCCSTAIDDFVGPLLPDRWAAKAILVIRKR